MAKYCSEICRAICDFCKHYTDDSNTKERLSDIYAGEGWCKAKNTRVDASSYCEDDFECFRCE